MALPPFFGRVADAAAPLLGGLPNQALAERLEGLTVALRCPPPAAEDGAVREGYMLAVNLAARLYPRIAVDAPEDLAAHAGELAASINPDVELSKDGDLALVFSPAASDERSVSTIASGWNVAIDGAIGGQLAPAAAPAALAAAAIGMGEVFRTVFADLLPRGRTAPQPGSFDLVSLSSWAEHPARAGIDIGSAHLAGAGAIGEATALTLRVADAKGQLSVVDYQPLEEPNLQRYVLAGMAEVGDPKTAIVARALAESDVEVTEVPTWWGEDDRSGPGRDTVLVALDSGRDRIGVQAGLHRRLYNAYTGENDLGWSRHERFGFDEACLACLYWPRGPQPHGYETAASALRQDPRRVRLYFAAGTVAGDPMPPPNVELAPPLSTDELQRWMTMPIIDDIAEVLRLDRSELDRWETRPLKDLYQDVICGGAVVPIEQDGRQRRVIVPLAHQSALAGVMLASQLLVASDEELRHSRSTFIAGRIDVKTGVLGSIAIPEFPTEACICRDPVYCEAWKARWAS